ncbi:MAG TPA: tyrosine-type recombinase/integrase [Candidatus Bathyarchaeia archaeon]|nr:tyrosine-type recombinase/integrase [Candidatus Bathyarchaeia archaeon]
MNIPAGKSHITIEDALDEYTTTYMPSRNLAEKTRTEYTADMSDFVSFVASRGVREPQKIELRLLNEYMAELDKRGLAGLTRRRKASSIKSFFNFMENFDYIQKNVAHRLIPPKREETTPKVLTENEVKKLQLAVANVPRDAAIIELLLQTGIRLSELARLKTGDVYLPSKVTKDPENAGAVTVKRGKGGKDRVITLNHKACRALKTYLRVRPELDNGALFFSKFKSPISHKGYQWIIKKYLKEAEIKDAHVHSLRHTFGTQMAKKGVNLRVIQEAMGHADLKMTSRYVSLARELMDKEMQENAL